MSDKKLNIHLISSAFIIAGSVIINFVIQVVLSRFFGLATLGSYALWRNNIQLVSGLSKLGLSGFSLRELPVILNTGTAGQVSSFLKFAIALAIIGLILFNALFLIFFELNNSGYNQAGIFLLSTVLMTFIIILSAIIRVFGSVLVSIFFDRLGVLSLFLAFLLISVFTGKKINYEIWFLAALLITFVSLSAIFIIYSRKYYRSNSQLSASSSKPAKQNNITKKKWMTSMMSFFALDIGNILSVRSSLLIAGFFLTSVELGQYVFMLMLAGLIGLPLMGFNMVLAPRISAASADGNFDRAEKEINLIKLLSFISGLLIALIVYNFYDILELIIKQPNAVLPIVLAIMLVRALINASFGPVGTGLSMLGHQLLAAKVMIGLVVVKIPLAVLACYQFGMIGIAVVELIHVLLWNFMLTVLLNAKLKISKNAGS